MVIPAKRKTPGVAFIALLALVAFAAALAQTGASPEVRDQGRRDVTRDATRSPTSGPAEPPEPPDCKLPDHARARLGTTRLRHEGYVGGFAFSPDGKTLASTGHDGARFWDVATGAPVPAPRGFGDSIHVTAVEYSPDGRKMAIGHFGGVAKLLDLGAAEAITLPQSHTGRVFELTFAPNGRTLATASPEDQRVLVWDVASGRERRTLAFPDQIHRGGLPLAFSPDGRRLAVGAVRLTGRMGMIGIWDLDGDARPVMIGNVSNWGLSSLAFTPDGRTIISGGSDRRPSVGDLGANLALELFPKIRIWDPVTGRLVRELDLGDVTALCKVTLSRDGKTLVSAHRDRLIVWDLPSGKINRTIMVELREPGVGIGKSLVLAPDGRTIAAARGDHTVHLWDIATGKPSLLQGPAHQSAVCSAAIAPDGRLVATADQEGAIQIWDAPRGQHLRRIELREGGHVCAIQFARDGRTLGAVGEYFDAKVSGFRGIARLWDLPGGTLKREFPVDYRAVQLALSPDGRHVAIALAGDGQRVLRSKRSAGVAVGNQMIIVGEIATGRQAAEFLGDGGQIRALGFASDGETIIFADDSTTFRFWNFATDQVTREIAIAGHRHVAPHPEAGTPTEIVATTFSTDLKTAVTAGYFDDQLLVWDLETGRARRTLHVETYTDGMLALSPDGRLVAASLSAAGDKPDATIRIWNVNTKREVLRLAARTGAARSLVFSADGRTLVSGMSDTTVLIWDISAAYEGVKRSRE
ncbi:MAG: WD40 repeat domain-containing protein [Isosphaerales bacterium]